MKQTACWRKNPDLVPLQLRDFSPSGPDRASTSQSGIDTIPVFYGTLKKVRNRFSDANTIDMILDLPLALSAELVHREK